MPEIKIQDETFEELARRAKPFVDTPDSVIRRLLGLDGDGATVPLPAGPKAGGGTRAAPGSILPEREYELPILEELLARKGSGHAIEVTDAVGERLKDRLTELDKQRHKSGDLRWRNRVQFTRLRLKERGLLRANSDRGVWELTDAGRKAAESGELST
jgi:hypothetical protein